MATTSAYDPLAPAARPGGRPDTKPKYRVLVHKRFKNHYDRLVDMVGLQQAQQFWDHVSASPGAKCAVAPTCQLKGKAGKPQGAGWSRTVHYEVSSAARIDYQFNDNYSTSKDGDRHPVVAILTISYSSH